MKRPELCILGAGIIGTTTAYIAKEQHPEWEVVLVDQSLAGLGATAFSGGHMHPHGHDEVQKEYAIRSARFYAALERTLRGVEFYRLPLYGIISKGRLLQAINGYFGTEAHLASENEKQKVYGTFSGLQIAADQALLAGVTSQYASPPVVLHAMLRSLRAGAGFSCIEGLAITQVHTTRQGVTLRTKHDESLHARAAILATGPWLVPGLNDNAAKKLGIRVKKVAALHIEMPVSSSDPMLYFFDNDAYLMPLAHRGHWIFSFASDVWDCLPDAETLLLSRTEAETACSLLRTHLPSIADRVRGSRVFCDSYTSDRRPLVRPIPDYNNCIIATAGSGFGFRLAPAIAQDAVQLVAHCISH